MNTSKHTLTQFDAELEAVREQVMQMGGLVENQIRLVMEAQRKVPESISFLSLADLRDPRRHPRFPCQS